MHSVLYSSPPKSPLESAGEPTQFLKMIGNEPGVFRLSYKNCRYIMVTVWKKAGNIIYRSITVKKTNKNVIINFICIS